jgi:hypothetical protein
MTAMRSVWGSVEGGGDLVGAGVDVNSVTTTPARWWTAHSADRLRPVNRDHRADATSICHTGRPALAKTNISRTATSVPPAHDVGQNPPVRCGCLWLR